MDIEEALNRNRGEDIKKVRRRRIGSRTMNMIIWLGKGEGQYKASEGWREIDEVECGQKEEH